MSDIDLIHRWLKAFQSSDYDTMATCYHPDATFTDIAFVLQGQKQIHAMWHMICENGIEVELKESPRATGETVTTKIIDTYKLSNTGRQVKNPVLCTFRFREGKIIEQRDKCDPIAWAAQAFGGIKGWFVGRIGLLRRIAARKKIEAFIQQHPQYAE